MNKFYIFFVLSTLTTSALAQNNPKLVSELQKNNLNNLGYVFKLKSESNLKKALILAKKNQWAKLIYTKNGGVKSLQSVDVFNHPRYLATFNNATCAATTHTNSLYAGGSLGIDINGASEILRNKLAIWDGGAVMANHQELINRVVFKDTARLVNYHATHVAGTMIASGVNPVAKGMAWGAPNLLAYNFEEDTPEMALAAGNLLVSNHSYGYQAGWVFEDNNWYWLGEMGQNEDYKFGFYDDVSHNWDAICYQAPYYLPVVACGNSRNENGPEIGQPYYAFSNTNGVPIRINKRPEGMNSNNSYEIMVTPATAKNVLSVGAIYPTSLGVQSPADIIISSFSSWGPTDDGRIKPDLVGQGVEVTSATNTSTTSYETLNGTSMASPNVSASLLLLQQYYAQLNQGKFMLAATLKALALHTTSEAGDAPGPDYVFGYGLLNMEKAATVIKNNGLANLILEKTLKQGETFTHNFISNGIEPIKITLCWTDPAGKVKPEGILNNPTPTLVNDLDTKLQNDSIAFLPWVLNPFLPSMAATKGNNIIDNVEQIVTDNMLTKQAFTLSVSHKGQLLNGSQNFSIIISGVQSNALDFSVYPNPSNTTLTLLLNSEKKQNLNYYISDTNGKKIYQKNKDNVFGVFSDTISVSNFKDGIYILNVQSEGLNSSKKISIKH
ncbi:MAG: T9SS C-terminal target domain-containing protein [Sphingobacteriales bacterium]|nr:MAG: T9SS C-terminal target domain-containing protein [Sphingobacteriales bacterium]TAF78238.1 MAG: T9SS C-terminal target domain-containing protein [Sphingobacteriales bacterium]